MLAQHFGDGKNDVGCGNTSGDLASELEANDAGDQHGDGLAKHCCFSLDAANTPAQDAEAVFHGGVGVGTDAGVRVCEALIIEDDASQVFDVDLVDDAGSRRNDAEVGECLGAPTQELVALFVALVLDFDVLGQSVVGTECFDDHRVVDDHLGGVEGVDLIGVATEGLDGFAHSCQVDNTGNTGEVLHEDTGRGELDFDAGFSRCIPVGDSLDVLSGNVGAIFGAQQVLAKNLERVREFLHARNSVEGVVVVGLVANLKGAQGIEGVFASSHSC